MTDHEIERKQKLVEYWRKEVENSRRARYAVDELEKAEQDLAAALRKAELDKRQLKLFGGECVD